MYEVATIVIGVAGGLALFLYGVGKMSDALQAAAGDRIRQLLARFTNHPLAGVVTGAVITAFLQSSSLTTVLVVGFVSAGLMSLRQATGVIMGANLGTTLTIHIAAFRITDSAWALIALGFAVASMSRRDTIRQMGTCLLGLGLLFLALGQMSAATNPLRDEPAFAELMRRVEFAPWGILLGAGFTALVQSSSATSGLVIALVDEGTMRLPAAVAVILGSNLGTCVTALIASWNRPAIARQAALVHVLFNAIGVAAWTLLLPWLIWLVEHSALSVPRQVANAHTLFNGINILALIWFLGPITRLAQWLAPERRGAIAPESVPRYLEPALLGTPSLAMDRARMELGHVGDLIHSTLVQAREVILTGDREALDGLAAKDDDVDALYGQIMRYGREISRNPLSSRETQELEPLLAAAGYLENISDLICENLVQLGKNRVSQGLEISSGTQHLLEELFDFVTHQFTEAIRAWRDRDVEAARQVVGSKGLFSEVHFRVTTHLRRRMLLSTEQRLNRFQMEADLANHLQRIYYFTRRLARLVFA